MQNSFLHDPIYSEPGESVCLVLENNILNRTVRAIDELKTIIGKDTFSRLSADDLLILQYAFNAGRVTSRIASSLTGKSNVYSISHLKKLKGLNLLIWHGSSVTDSTQYYTFNTNL